MSETTVSSLDNSNINIYGGDLDMVAVAPFGTELPVGLTELKAPFKDCGWLNEDGIDWEDSYETSDFKGHQGGKTVISLPTSVDRTFKFVCEEETALTVGLRYSGFTPKQVGSEQAYGGEVPAPKMDPRAWVIDLHSISQDGIRKRFVIPKGVVSEVGTISHKREDMTLYEFTVKVMEGKFFMYSNAASWKPSV